jgi:hypothetical protein
VPVFKPAGEDRPGSHLAFNLAEIFGEFSQPSNKKKKGWGIQQRDFWELMLAICCMYHYRLYSTSCCNKVIQQAYLLESFMHCTRVVMPCNLKTTGESQWVLY